MTRDEYIERLAGHDRREVSYGYGGIELFEGDALDREQ